MNIVFKNQTIVVTGSTRGIGKDIAERFWELGGNVVFTGTNKSEIESLNEECGDRKHYCHLDFLDESSVSAFISYVQSLPRVDVCINNAGINRIQHIYDLSLNDWEDVVTVNLKGPTILLKFVGDIMKKQNYGRLVNIASIFGVITREKRAIYSTTKSGLLGLTRTASVDLAPYNVLVNAVSPGFISTDLTRQILSEDEICELAGKIPMGRLGEPADVTSIVLFLASTMNTYITGQNIIVDGGYVNI